MGGQFFQQQIFPVAFGGGRRVGGDVAGAAMQQAVIAARGAGIEVLLFSQYAFNTPQGQIAGQAGTGDTSADNEYLSFQSRPLNAWLGVDRFFQISVSNVPFFSCENKMVMLRPIRRHFRC